MKKLGVSPEKLVTLVTLVTPAIFSYNIRTNVWLHREKKVVTVGYGLVTDWLRILRLDKKKWLRFGYKLIMKCFVAITIILVTSVTAKYWREGCWLKSEVFTSESW
jgi:uncharacterized ion transporter superfamily protein YfcC